MGSLGRSVATTTVAAGLLVGSAAHAAPPAPIDTVDVLTEVIESLRTGDDAGYADAVDELVADGHWLPEAGWDAIEERDDEILSFVWLLLDAPPDDLFLFAFDQIAFERDLIASLDSLSVVDLGFLEVIDDDGATLLEVIDHVGLEISPPLRGALNPIADLDEAPGIALYDDALALVAGRLDRMGYAIPEIDGLDISVVPKPSAGPPPLPPLGDEIPAPGETPAESPTEPDGEAIADPEPDPADDPVSETDADSNDEPTVPVEPVEPVEQTDSDPVTAADSPDSEMSSSDDPVDPAIIALGAIAAIAILLALMALRGNRHTGRLADIAFTDALTGLANRRRLDDDLAHETRQGDRPTAVLMIDVDHFKQFNDDHGHAVGDEVLRRVADIIAANVRDVDLPYRYGGEEFSVLLPDTDHDTAQAVGERVRAAIECAHFDVGGEPVSVTASIGLSAGAATEVTQLVHRADQALYTAKDNGRNQLARG